MEIAVDTGKDFVHSSEETNITWACFQQHPDVYVKTIVAVDVILCVVSVFGNLLVIIAVLRYRQLRNVTNVFVVGLAAADLLVGLNVPYYVLFYFDIKVLTCHRVTCLLRYWFATYATGCSMLCFVGVAVDRYVAILYPLSYHRIMRTKCASYFLIASWIATAVVSSLPVAGIGERFSPKTECELYYTHTRSYVLSSVAALVMATFLVTTLLYALVFREAWRQNKAIAAMELSQNMRQERKIAKTMAMVLILNFLGFLPYFCIITSRYIKGVDQEHVSSVKPYVVVFFFGKSAVNPFLYAWQNKGFYMAFRRLLLRENRSNSK